MRRVIFLCIFAIISVMIFNNDVLAQNPPPEIQKSEKVFSESQFLTQREFIIAVSVMVFGLLILLSCYVLGKTKTFDGDQLIRLVCLIIIVTGTLVLVATGYDATQIAPALGILGTIAGYMLGKSANSTSDKNEEKAAHPKEQAQGVQNADIQGVQR